MASARLLLSLFLAALPGLAQPCEPSSQVKAAIDAATPTAGASREDRIAPARSVRDRFPGDYYAHRYYQEQFFSGGVFAESLRAEYQALLDSHPGDPIYRLLYARALLGSDTRRTIELVDAILERDPQNAMAHRKLTEIYSAPAFLDLDKLRAHLTAYWSGCPSSTVGYNLADRIEDKDFVRGAAARLRSILETRTDDEALQAFETLWRLEFKTVPLTEETPVRERVRADVARLRAMDVEAKPFLVSVIGQGYQVLGDKEGESWAKEHTPKVTGGPNTPAQVISQWHRDHPFPRAGSEKSQREFLNQSIAWVRQWPEDPQARSERFNALRGWQDAPLEETVAAAEDWIRVYEAHPAYVAPYFQVAAFYAQHNLRYVELPGLVEKALAQALALHPVVSDLYLPLNNSVLHYSIVQTRNEAANIYLKIGNYQRAHELLDQVLAGLAELDDWAQTAPDNMKPQVGYLKVSYWHNVARLARLEEHGEDALQADRNALWANTLPGNRDYLRSTLRDRWIAVKGSEEGFDAWVTSPGEKLGTEAKAPVVASPSRWATMDKPLPDFSLLDATGKIWSLADLKGKVTLINVWATWCGPCREELPHLQKLYEKVRGRTDVAVLTLSIDANLGMILPFVAENHYTFPVLAADEYVRKVSPDLSIPRNWIVDAHGVLRRESVGFGGDGSHWVDDTLAALEQARPQ